MSSTKKLKIAFAGFRHGHILSLYALAQAREDLEVVAACEEHAETRVQLQKSGSAEITHTDLDSFLAVDADIVAVGDYFAQRGLVAVRALEAGRQRYRRQTSVYTDGSSRQNRRACAAKKAQSRLYANDARLTANQRRARVNTSWSYRRDTCHLLWWSAPPHARFAPVLVF